MNRKFTRLMCIGIACLCILSAIGQERAAESNIIVSEDVRTNMRSASWPDSTIIYTETGLKDKKIVYNPWQIFAWTNNKWDIYNGSIPAWELGPTIFLMDDVAVTDFGDKDFIRIVLPKGTRGSLWFGYQIFSEDYGVLNQHNTTYDTKGNLTLFEVGNERNGYAKYNLKYNTTNQIISMERYSAGANELIGTANYTYSDKGKLTYYEYKQTEVDPATHGLIPGTPLSVWDKEINTYDAEGRLVSTQHFESDQEKLVAGKWSTDEYSCYFIEYDYDSNGNQSCIKMYNWSEVSSSWSLVRSIINYPNESDYLTFNNTLFKYYGDGGDVVIPDDLGITTIGESAFEGNSTITSVVIPSGVTEIGQSAFMNCEKLASVSIPTTVTTIKEEAFFNSKLESVAIPNAVVTIGTGAFGACETLTAINVNSTNSSYSSNEGVLYDNSKSLLHTYPGGKEGTFAVPNTVTKINNEAFYGSNVAAVTLNDKTQSIGDKAFNSCKKLTSIDIPSSVSTIGQSAFENSSKLEVINVSASNTKYSSGEGVLYDKNKTQLITYPENKQGASVVIPSTVSSIENAAFSGSKLTSVNIPSSVTTIKESAFKNNTKLETVEIPSSVKTIQNLIFSNCTELKDITVKWSTPLSVPEDIFKGVKTSDVTLHVPAGKESAYKNAEVWKNFKITSTPVSTEHIGQVFLQARLTSGTLYVAGLRTGETISVYNINGQLLHKETVKAEEVQISLTTTKGVFIVTAGEKTVKVVEN